MEEIQDVILTTIKVLMWVPKNTSDKLFFMLVAEGGCGLVHLLDLLDLQTTLTCSGTLWELTTLVLSTCTTAASWHLAYTVQRQPYGVMGKGPKKPGVAGVAQG